MESFASSNYANPDTTKLFFSTYFKRPNSFRFSWRNFDCDADSVIWCDGRKAFAKYSYELQPRLIESLNLAVAAATGVSGSTAHTISSLLMEDVSGRKLTDLKDLVYVGTEILNGEECHHLQHSRRDRHIFISKSTFAVLKIDRKFQIIDETAEVGDVIHVTRSTVYDEVLFNPDISDELFSEHGKAINDSPYLSTIVAYSV